MDAMRIYRAPNGACYRYHEGKAPEGYVLVEQPKAQPKQRAPRNKARKADNK